MDVREQVLSQHPVGVNAYYGVISRTLPDFQTEAYAILPDFSADLEWGPCRWQARDDINTPVKGNQCLVVFDSRRQPWIIAWWPF